MISEMNLPNQPNLVARFCKVVLIFLKLGVSTLYTAGG